MKIYTKTGDQGTSSLYNGERRDKTDIAFQTLGDVDELNSLCGVAREFLVEIDPDRSEQVTAHLVGKEATVHTNFAHSPCFHTAATNSVQIVGCWLSCGYSLRQIYRAQVAACGF